MIFFINRSPFNIKIVFGFIIYFLFIYTIFLTILDLFGASYLYKLQKILLNNKKSKVIFNSPKSSTFYIFLENLLPVFTPFLYLN